MKKFIKTKGFTLVELLMVLAILVVVFFSAITQFPFIRDQFEFEKSVNDISGIFQDGKFMAMSNKVYPDETDYDNDGLFDGDGDAILPNGYIIDVDLGGANATLALYADVFGSNIGDLDVGACSVCDVFIREVVLEDDKNVTISVYDEDFQLQASSTTFKVLYDVPGGTFDLLGSSTNSSLEFKIEDIKQSEVARDRYVFIHYFQGVPERFRETVNPN